MMGTVILIGCKKNTNVESTGWATPADTTEVTVTPVETPSITPERVPSITPEETPSDAPTTDTKEDSSDYKSVALTLSRPKSKLYTYVFTSKKSEFHEITKSKTYEGFLNAKTTNGNTVLLTTELTPVVYPKSKKYKVLEPFLSDNRVYFRVEDKHTNWKEVEDACGEQVWSPLGGYAVVDGTGKQVIKFGKYDYIDKFVDGKARAYSKKKESYYIIDVTGKELKTYPMEDKVVPYKLYPDGFIYLRRDSPNHSHALIDWNDKVVIHYGVYQDNIHPKYLGNGTFVVNNDVLIDGTLSGVVLYSTSKEQRKLPKNSYDVFTAEENKYVTGMITNGLVGPLAKWEYIVTDYAGKVLIEQGKYKFDLGGWSSGYAVAKTETNKLVLLDSNCNEVTLPDDMQLLGRYSSDAALFVVRVTKDFQLWKYSNVPSRYDNPIGVVDKDFNWVLPPGEVDYLRNLPITKLNALCEYKRGQKSMKGSYLSIIPISEAQ